MSVMNSIQHVGHVIMNGNIFNCYLSDLTLIHAMFWISFTAYG